MSGGCWNYMNDSAASEILGYHIYVGYGLDSDKHEKNYKQVVRDMDRAQKDTPVISKELFCTAIHLLKEQESIDDEFGRALQKVGNGHFAYGTENKYREALLMVLRNAINDQYDYIDWWLYEGAPDYKIWNEDESIEWDLTEPEALYDFITTECK